MLGWLERERLLNRVDTGLGNGVGHERVGPSGTACARRLSNLSKVGWAGPAMRRWRTSWKEDETMRVLGVAVGLLSAALLLGDLGSLVPVAFFIGDLTPAPAGEIGRAHV